MRHWETESVSSIMTLQVEEFGNAVMGLLFSSKERMLPLMHGISPLKLLNDRSKKFTLMTLGTGPEKAFDANRSVWRGDNITEGNVPLSKLDDRLSESCHVGSVSHETGTEPSIKLSSKSKTTNFDMFLHD